MDFLMGLAIGFILGPVVLGALTIWLFNWLEGKD